MLKRTALAFITVLGLANAANPVEPNPNDHSSYSNTLDIVTKHFHLDLTVDFTKKVLTGSNTLTLDVMNRTTMLVLDIMDIDVTNAYLLKGTGKDQTKTKLAHEVLTPNANLG